MGTHIQAWKQILNTVKYKTSKKQIQKIKNKEREKGTHTFLLIP